MDEPSRFDRWFNRVVLFTALSASAVGLLAARASLQAQAGLPLWMPW